MSSDCEHSKAIVTDDDGREVCPICDDIQVETLDDDSPSIDESVESMPRGDEIDEYLDGDE